MKAIKFLLLIILMNLINIKPAESQVTQEWAGYWNLNGSGSEAKCAAVDNSGNSVISGRVLLSGPDIATVKFDSDGNLMWSRIYDNSSQYLPEEGVSDLVIDDQNNIYITGYTANSVGANKNIVTIKYSPGGDSLWVRQYAGSGNGNDEGKAIALDDSGNVYVTGYSTTSGTNKDYLTIKYDYNGNEIWVRSSNYLTSINNIANDITVDDQGNVYVTGNTNFFLTLKYNSSGDSVWTNTYYDNGGAHSVRDKKLVADKSGNVYVTGTSRGLTTNEDFVTIKYDSTGNQLWMQRYTSPSMNVDNPAALKLVYETGNEMHPDLVVAGTSQTNFLTVKYDGDNGNVLWEKRYNGQSRLRSMDIDEYGNVIVAGDIYNVSTGYDYLTLKYDGITGDERWSIISGLNGTSGDYPVNVSVGPDGAVCVSGYSNPWTYHFYVVKYKESAALELTALIEGMYDGTLDRMIEDTVTVLLRNTSSPFDIVDSATAVLDSNGKSIFLFNNTTNGIPYYIIIKHRNSIETWSSSGVAISDFQFDYDFTSASDKAYGNNQILKGSKYCIISGDVDQSGTIDLVDLILVNNDIYNSVTGYVNSNVNGDGLVDMSDILIVNNNSSNIIIKKTPESVTQKLKVKFNDKELKQNSAEDLKLNDNYPNPFNPVTKISYELRVTNYVSLKVFDIVGKDVATLINEMQNAGTHSVTFDASNLSSGTYFYKLESGGFSILKKMMVVK